MADSDSDNFESADEGFSDVEDVGPPDVMAPSPSGNTNKESVTKDYNISSDSSEEQDVSSALKNLNLQESKLSSSSILMKEKETTSLSEETVEKKQTVLDKPKAFESPKKTDVIKNDASNAQPTISKDDSTKLSTSRSASEKKGTGKFESNDNLSSESSPKLSQSACDSIPSSDRTDEFKAYTQTSVEKPQKLPESVVESPLSSCNLEQARFQSTQRSCESNSAAKTGFESNLRQEDLDDSSWGDGWEVDKNSESLPTQSTNKNLETTSNPNPPTEDSFRDENVDEGLWDDGWEVDDTLTKTSKPVPFEPTNKSSEITLKPQSSTESNLKGKHDVRKTDSVTEIKSQLAPIQSVQNSDFKENDIEKASSGSEKTKSTSVQLGDESMLKIESSPKSDFSAENVEESTWDDGWGTEDFETGSVDTKTVIETETGLDSSKMENKEDEGWDDGWDTEEVNFSSKEEKPSLQPSRRSEVMKKEGIETPQKVKQDIEKKRSVLNEESKLSQQKQDGWFGWGVTNILSSATEGLSSITSNVTSAFESTIGAPDPTEMLRAQKEANQSEEPVSDETKSQEVSGFTDNLFSVSSWTKFVESTGNRVLTTGLDTLETIGKKTMEVIQEGDPGLKKKRAKLREFVSEPGKPVLSQVLREAKERAETSSRTNETALIESRVNFEILFDDFEGLVHLEALEMISKQCQIKLDSLGLKFSGNEAKNFKETLQEVEELCELPEDDETNSKEAMADSRKFKLRIQEVLAQLGVDIQFDKLLQTNEIVESRLQKEYSNPLELHQIVISSLAEISAAAMQVFHRAAEMLVIKTKHSTIAETDSLMSFGKLVCSKLEVIAEKFSSKLKKIDPSDTAKVSHISKEATNSTTYTQNACHLLVPILQYGAVA